MKFRLQNWRRSVGFLTVSFACVTLLSAQTEVSQDDGDSPVTKTTSSKVLPPDAQETIDASLLIDAVNAGDTITTVEILRKYGVAEDILQATASRLNLPSSQVELKEPFLKASLGALALTDKMLKTNVQNNLTAIINERGYERPIWIPRPPDKRTIPSYDADLTNCHQEPILFLDQKSNDSCFIRYFKLYDRYAERIHSVALNGARLNNSRIHSDAYIPVSRQLNALFKLIKARKPDAFVWLSVVKQDNHSDESWLKIMTFKPDGLQILNLSQFHSPFALTRQRYREILNTDQPMMVSDFLGYSAAIKQGGTNLAVAIRNKNPETETTATGQLGGIGAAGPKLEDTEAYLQSLGYRGISVSWLLLMAQANATNALSVDRSNLPDERIGLLDLDFDKKNYAHMLSVAKELISSSAPGDINWTVGKLYQGIGLLKQTPPDRAQAVKTLDEVLNFNFTNRLGRNHYILGAVKWRIYAAAISNDKNKILELTQWVQTQPFLDKDKAVLLKQTAHSSSVSPASNIKK